MWEIKWKYGDRYTVKSLTAETTEEKDKILKRIKDIGMILVSVEEKELYSNCYTCRKGLYEGQEIVTIHQYHYCNDYCLEKDKKKVKLGD